MCEQNKEEKMETVQALKKALQENDMRRDMFEKQIFEKENHYMKMVESERNDKKNIVDTMYAEIERRSNEKNKNLLEKIITMEEREIQIRNNLDEKETKIGMLEKKYHLCAVCVN